MTKVLMTPDEFDAYRKALDAQWDAATKKLDAKLERKAKRDAAKRQKEQRFEDHRTFEQDIRLR